MNRLKDSSLSEGSSFHGHTVNASKEDLEKVCGEVM